MVSSDYRIIIMLLNSEEYFLLEISWSSANFHSDTALSRELVIAG